MSFRLSFFFFPDCGLSMSPAIHDRASGFGVISWSLASFFGRESCPGEAFPWCFRQGMGRHQKKSFDFTAKELGEHEFDAQKRCIKKKEKRSDQHVFVCLGYHGMWKPNGLTVR